MPLIEVRKNCVYIEISDKEIYYMKKECILGYKGYEGGYKSLYIDIYTNIPDTKISVKFEHENYGEKYRNYIAILDRILSPELQAPADLLAL